MGLLLTIGMGCGIALALGGAQFGAALLYGVTPHDPLMLGGAIVLLTIVSLVASFVPARRATRIEPAVALRIE